MNHNQDPTKDERAGEKCPLPEWLSKRLDIPSDLWTGGMRMELRGRNSMVIHGCHRIVGYRPDEVRLRMKGCIVVVRGQRLGCISYLAGAVELNGQIDSLCFEEGDKTL
jgi:sporulation protein YqfC